MNTTLIAQIKEHEGLELEPYECTSGKWTIGYGRNFQDNPLDNSELSVIIESYKHFRKSPGFEEDRPLIVDGRNLAQWPFTPHEVMQLLNSGCFTVEHAEMLLKNDLERIESQLKVWIKYFDSLCEVRQATLINMAYQMGVPGLLKFKKTLSYVAQGKYEEAAKEMLDSKWARKQTSNRAKEMSEQMRTGQFQ